MPASENTPGLPRTIAPASRVHPQVEIRASGIHGRGLFATAHIPAGEKVIAWGGKIFTPTKIRAGAAATHSYAAIRPGIFLGHPREQGNSPDDHVNHSYDPNIWMINEITWEARRNIKAGEELTADCACFW